MNIMKENLKVSTAFLISACSSFSFYKVPVTQGNIFEEEDIEKLQVGQSMDQVQFILGSPMIKDPFHSNRWDYLNLITIGDEKIVEKKLIVIFDDKNLLSSWKIVSE
jgi:outer membrane protein assembly factor BamE